MPRVTLSKEQIGEVMLCLPSPTRLEEDAGILQRYGEGIKAAEIRERAKIVREIIGKLAEALERDRKAHEAKREDETDADGPAD